MAKKTKKKPKKATHPTTPPPRPGLGAALRETPRTVRNQGRIWPLALGVIHVFMAIVLIAQAASQSGAVYEPTVFGQDPTTLPGMDGPASAPPVSVGGLVTMTAITLLCWALLYFRRNRFVPGEAHFLVILYTPGTLGNMGLILWMWARSAAGGA